MKMSQRLLTSSTSKEKTIMCPGHMTGYGGNAMLVRGWSFAGQPDIDMKDYWQMMMRAAAERWPRNWPDHLNSLDCEIRGLGEAQNGIPNACAAVRVAQPGANVASMDARFLHK